MAQTKKKTSGPRPKPVPTRLCIACRRSETKRGLIRLVRTAEGRVAIDTTGKRAGRGAYLCHQPSCWEQALKRHGLERALRIETIEQEDRDHLNLFALRITQPQAVNTSPSTHE